MKLVDIYVYNCKIRAHLVQDKYSGMPMPNNDVGRIIFLQNMPFDRLDSSMPVSLKEPAMKRAEKIVEESGGINVSGMYGSMYVKDDEIEMLTDRADTP